MECTDDGHKAKEHAIGKDKKSIEIKIGMSQNENNDLKKKLKNKDSCKVKCNNEDIANKTKTLQDEDNENKDGCEDGSIKYKDEEEELKNGAHKVKMKNKDIGKGKKNSEAGEASKNKHACKIKSCDESMEEEYCSEATFLARQMALAERLRRTESIQLYNLRVQLRHMVLPQHEIETRAGSHMPTRKEIEEFEKIIPLKRGSYSFEEDKIIASNWKAFCKLHNWNVNNVKPFLQLRTDGSTYMRNTTERRKFVQFLADGLPDRTLYSVYHRFRNLYEDNLQRRYKPDEDQMIIDHLEHNPSLDERRKYADLAKVLRRTRNSIWRRYRILKRKNKRCKDD